MRATHRDLRGWIELSADVNWEDYGGTWARKGPDGGWYIVKFENQYDLSSEKECRLMGVPQYLCEVKYCNIPDVRDNEIAGALKYVGMEEYIIYYDTDNSWRYRGRKASPEVPEVALLDALVSYGIAGVLTSFSSDTAPVGIRKQALKYARDLMKDDVALDEALDQQANAYGNTVRDFARGQIG